MQSIRNMQFLNLHVRDSILSGSEAINFWGINLRNRLSISLLILSEFKCFNLILLPRNL